MKKLFLVAALSCFLATSAHAERMAVDPAWQNSLMQQLQQAQYYPSGARARQEQGTVILSFTVDRDGHVLVHDIAHSSGFPELDKEAGAMLMRAKLPAFPASMPQKRIDLTIPIRFALPASPPPAADRIESKRSATDQLIENKRQIDRLIGTDESRAQSGSRRNEKVEAQNSSNPAYPLADGQNFIDYVKSFTLACTLSGEGTQTQCDCAGRRVAPWLTADDVQSMTLTLLTGSPLPDSIQAKRAIALAACTLAHP